MTDWVPIAGGDSLPPLARMRVMLAGAEFVLWRSAAGVPHLWGNRCPHRGMRLSFGIVRGEDLLCIYHGWRYDGSGRCAAIPAHPDLEPPQTIAATTRALAERDGLLWAAGTGAPPDLAALAGGRTFAFCRSIHVDCPLDRLKAAVAAHFAGEWALAEVAGGLIRLDAGDRVAVAGFHEPAEGRSALHATVAGATAQERVAFARSLAALRDRLTEEAA